MAQPLQIRPRVADVAPAGEDEVRAEAPRERAGAQPAGEDVRQLPGVGGRDEDPGLTRREPADLVRLHEPRGVHHLVFEPFGEPVGAPGAVAGAGKIDDHGTDLLI